MLIDMPNTQELRSSRRQGVGGEFQRILPIADEDARLRCPYLEKGV